MTRIRALSAILSLSSLSVAAAQGTLHCQAIEDSGTYIKSMEVDFTQDGDKMIVHWNGKTYVGEIDTSYNPRSPNQNRVRFNGFLGMGNDSGLLMYSGNERYANEPISMKVDQQLLDGEAGSVKVVGDYGRDDGPSTDFLVCK